MGSLLTGVFADSEAPTINLSEVPASAFEAALAFCYQGSCTVPDDADLEALLTAAARLQILDLRAAASSALAARPGSLDRCSSSRVCNARSRSAKLGCWGAEAVMAGAPAPSRPEGERDASGPG